MHVSHLRGCPRLHRAVCARRRRREILYLRAGPLLGREQALPCCCKSGAADVVQRVLDRLSEHIAIGQRLEVVAEKRSHAAKPCHYAVDKRLAGPAGPLLIANQGRERTANGVRTEPAEDHPELRHAHVVNDVGDARQLAGSHRRGRLQLGEQVRARLAQLRGGERGELLRVKERLTNIFLQRRVFICRRKGVMQTLSDAACDDRGRCAHCAPNAGGPRLPHLLLRQRLRWGRCRPR